jgi:hypothetical protein
MPALETGIHVRTFTEKTWMAGSSPAVTTRGVVDLTRL